MTSTATGATQGPGLTLSDVASLAHVQRPVVSRWRTRFAGSEHPFPSPIGEVEGVAQFDAEDVVGWLERTGLGNNAQARDDVAAYARPPGLSSRGDARQVAGASALLCLKAVTGLQLTGLCSEELLDLADEADPDDGFLYREIAGLGQAATACAGYVDRLADASYGPARAFEKRLADRFRLHHDGSARTALSDDARRLVARMAAGLAEAVDLQPPVFVDPTCGGSDLLVEVAGLLAEVPAPTMMTSDDDDDSCRLVRRRLRVHDLHREPLVRDDNGGFQLSRPLVLLAQFPSAGAPSMTDLEILSAIDDVVLQMDARQLAVVVAPAAVLTDRPASAEAARIRDGLLRSDRVRAIVRLRRGLLLSAPRQSLAWWALGPAYPEVRVGDRWTLVGDLADVELDQAAVEDLVTDVVAAMGDDRLTRSHAFRFLHRVRRPDLLGGPGSLVDHVVRRARRRTASGADVAIRVTELARSLGLGDDAGTADLSVEAAEHDDTEPSPELTVGHVLRRGAVRLVPGNRVDAAHLGGRDGARVIGPAELAGTLPWGGRRIDRLEFARAYPSGRLTRPGDVVFCTSPSVAARVDVDGGSVVVSPARVLRPVDGKAMTITPDVLAADINAVPPRAKHWRTWPVRRTPRGQAEPLGDALTALRREREAARDRLAQLEELTGLLVAGVTGQVLAIRKPSTSRQEGR